MEEESLRWLLCRFYSAVCPVFSHDNAFSPFMGSCSLCNHYPWCHKAKSTPASLVFCRHSLNSSHRLVFQSHHWNNFLLSDSPFFCFSHSSLVTIWFLLQSEPESGWLGWLETGFKKTQKKAISSLWHRLLMTKPDPSAWVYPDYHSQP